MIPRPVSPNDPAEWDAWADAYGADVDWLEEIHNPDLEAILAPAGKKVLDAGCGTGRRARTVLRRAASVLAVDFSEGMTRVAGEVLAGTPGSEVLRLDLERERLPDAHDFDAVMAVSVLHHVASPDVFIGELKRVLKPGGRLVIVDHVAGRPVGHLLRYYLEVLLTRSPLRLAGAFVKGFLADTMLSRHKRREARMTLEEFGLRYSGALPGARVEVRHGIFGYLIWDKP